MDPAQTQRIHELFRLKIYTPHNQENAIKFVDYVLAEFPFRVHMIRTDNGHEFQAKFHWHVQDLGIDHVYIKPHSPRLNGKVERSHRTDQAEFYQLLEYKGDVDLEKRLAEWQQYYNLHRPHTAHDGRTPFEVLHDKLTGKKHTIDRAKKRHQKHKSNRQAIFGLLQHNQYPTHSCRAEVYLLISNTPSIQGV